MNARLRRQRNEFLVFLAGTYVSLLCALPVVAGNLALAQRMRANVSMEGLTFEQLDRNRDGYVDRSEAQSIDGLASAFGDAERLNKVQFARALGVMTDRGRR